MPIDVLNLISTIAQSLSAVAVVAGGAFAATQLRAMRNQRRDLAVIEAVHEFRTPDLRKAMGKILPLERPVGDADIALDPSLADAIEEIVYAGESCGVLVCEGAIGLATIDRSLGGFLRRAWEQIKGYVLIERHRRHTENYAEFFQWLVEGPLTTHERRCRTDGAHNWNPTGKPPVCCCKSCVHDESKLPCKRPLSTEKQSLDAAQGTA